MRTTDTPKSERVIKIYSYLIRNRTRKYTAKRIHHYLSQSEPVSLRNVQRDLKELADLTSSHVISITDKGRLYYQIEPDMRDKLTLPIQRNAIMALFLLKKLQSFFAPKAKTFKDMGEAIAELSTPADYDLFEDFDEKLDKQTQVLGEHSALALNEGMLNDMITALVEKRRLKIRYLYNYGEEPKTTSICPVKLVMHKGELYFFCITVTKPHREYWMKLCRILDAELTGTKFTLSPERKAKIEKRLNRSSGILSDDKPKAQKIEMKFPGYFARIFNEKRFHPTQKMRTNKKGDVILSLEVPVDIDLIQWVLGWSDSVIVLKPKNLRDELREIGKFLIKNYK